MSYCWNYVYQRTDAIRNEREMRQLKTLRWQKRAETKSTLDAYCAIDNCTEANLSDQYDELAQSDASQDVIEGHTGGLKLTGSHQDA